MQASSASTRSADPYRAGLELGKKLAANAPEVVFLFSTVQYGNTDELLEGLYDGTGNDNLVVIGNTGDGYHCSSGVADAGASAVGLNSAGKVRWLVENQSGVSDNPVETTRSVLRKIEAALEGAKPAFMFLVSDFRTDASEIEKVIEFETDVPVIGGFAADDNQMKSCFLYCNRKALVDAVVLLAAVGPLQFDVIIGNTLTAVGNPGTIDAADGANILAIDGTSATDFIERETGKPVLHSDSGITSLTIIDSDEPEVTRLRSIVPKFSKDDRALGLYGGISPGKRVQVCLAQPEEMVREIYSIAEAAKNQGWQPAAALIVSCVGRKWLLGKNIDHEIRSLAEQFGSELPLTGFPSFGEIGPLRTSKGFSRNLFHNMTYVLLLIGQQ